MSLVDRLRLFEKDLDDKYERIDAIFHEERNDFDNRVRLKAERAEIDITRHAFKRLFERLFERELRSWLFKSSRSRRNGASKLLDLSDRGIALLSGTRRA
jgi:hypothetical protein